MKKCFSFYLCFLILLFPLSLKAMEGSAQEADKLALEKLRALVVPALPEIQYNIQRDRDGDAVVLGAADVHLQEVLPITIWLDNIFSCLIEKRDFNKADFHSLALTCKFFNLLTNAALFSLNEYCLTESRPHTIPRGLLQIKTRNTKDGILKLAALLSVTSTDLSQWFGPDLLKSVLFAQIVQLPDHLEGLAEEDIRKLYALYKIGKALLRVGAVDRSQLDLLIKLFGKIPPMIPGLYGPLQRLRSLGTLTTDLIEDDKTKDLDLFFSEVSEGREFVARELLMAGESVPVVNYHMFVASPQTREVAIQLSEWCLHNPRLCNFQQISSLISGALILKRSDLADRALSRIAALPNDANTINFKVLSFVLYKDTIIKDAEVQSSFELLLMSLYEQYWPHIIAEVKAEAVSLLAYAKRAEVPQAVDNLLLKPVVRNLITSKVLKDLHQNNFPEEVRKVVNYLLKEGRAEFISIIKTRKLAGIKGLDSAAKFCMMIAYEESMAVLREVASSQDVDTDTQLAALHSLSRSLLGDKNKDYITSQLKCMDLKKLADSMDIDARMILAGIYYYLGDQEACRFHFLDFLKEIAKLESSEHLRRSLIKKIRADFQQMGLAVKSIADLQAIDPLELFKIMDDLDKKKVDRQMAPS